MTKPFLKFVVVGAFLIGLGFAPAVRADGEGPIKLTLHPMAAPSPALRYRLLPTYPDQTSGNAAVYYGKIKAEEGTFFNNRDLWDKIGSRYEIDWQQMPIEQLKHEDIKPQPSSWPVSFLEQGAKCKYCDWQLPVGETPFYKILLPEAQESRQYMRMLAVKARWEISMGRYDDAIQTFRINYALSRNVAQGETLVNCLIGIAGCGIMFPQVVEYVQQPKAPNLYWAITNLPQPMIDFRRGLEVESQALELSFPELRDVADAKRTPEEWRDLFHRFADDILAWNHAGNAPPPVKTPDELDKLCKDFAPIAKKTLIAEGMPAEKINAMSADQLALVYSLRTYHILYDDAARGFFLPYPTAKQSIEIALDRYKNPSDDLREFIPITQRSIQAIDACRDAIARNERQFAVLRLLEALRLYAASHDGNLPTRLSDITEVPIPEDPVTGKSFDYQLVEGKGLIKAPALTYMKIDYEVTMVKKK